VAQSLTLLLASPLAYHQSRLVCAEGEGELMSTNDAVLIANEAFYAAFRARDMKAMEAVWAEEAAVTCIHPGWNAIEGRAEVMESWAGILKNPNAPKIRCHAPSAQVHGSAALVVCYEVLDGGVLIATNAFREAAGWRMVHHHAGPANAMPPNPATSSQIH